MRNILTVVSLALVPAVSSPATPVAQEIVIHDCDRLAAAPLDRNRVVDGVGQPDMDTAAAIPACRAAVEAEPSNPRFLFQLGRAYDAAGEEEAALAWYRRAADADYPAAFTNIGYQYEHGHGVAADLAESVRWYMRAAELGDPTGTVNLAVAYDFGRGIAVDLVEAARLYRIAADAGDDLALHNLGAFYLNGTVVGQDYAEALRLFEAAAAQGRADALNKLGLMYDEALGVEEDNERAAGYYRAAADKGLAVAMYNLALLHEAGEGVEADLDAAFALFRKAADGGYRDAITARALAAAACLCASAAPVAAQSAPYVDLELVLAVDISRSMDYDELGLQRQGYVEALRHPEVIQAIESGPNGRIAVTYVEWAGTASVVVPWATISNRAEAEAFAEQVGTAPIGRARGTSISLGLGFSARLFESSGVRGLRRAIDVSGDGPNNIGMPVEQMRESVVADGITINGLPIMLKSVSAYGPYNIPDLDIYYEDCVIGGPGAFVVTVDDPARFAIAIRRKLVLEIAGRMPEPEREVQASVPEPAATEGLVVPIAEFSQPARVDCMVGEKARGRWIFRN